MFKEYLEPKFRNFCFVADNARFAMMPAKVGAVYRPLANMRILSNPI